MLTHTVSCHRAGPLPPHILSWSCPLLASIGRGSEYWHQVFLCCGRTASPEDIDGRQGACVKCLGPRIMGLVLFFTSFLISFGISFPHKYMWFTLAERSKSQLGPISQGPPKVKDDPGHLDSFFPQGAQYVRK